MNLLSSLQLINQLISKMQYGPIFLWLIKNTSHLWFVLQRPVSYKWYNAAPPFSIIANYLG
jgi:hypothetical protein